MTFDQLEVMDMIVKYGSFKAAAAQLHRTQPTLSIAIKKLETEFDLQIFSRDEYRPKLTEKGQLFYKWAQECLESFRRLEVVGKELGTQNMESKLTIVVDPLVSFQVMSMIFDRCLGGAQPTEMLFRSEILGKGEELLLAGEADFAVAAKGGSTSEIESIPAERVPMLAVVARSLVDKKQKIDAEWLKSHPQIIVTTTLGSSVGVLEGGRHCFVTDHAFKRRMICEGFGWGRLARHEIAAELKNGSLLGIPEEAAPPFTLELFMMRHRHKAMGPVARNVWAHMKEVAPF